MRTKAGGVLPVVLLLATAVPAIADPISVINVRRGSFASATAGANTVSDEQQGTDAEAASATQVSGPSFASSAAELFSTVGTDTFTGVARTGTAQNGATVATGGFARSTYDLEFEVTAAQQFHFGGQFVTLGNDASHVSFWSAVLRGDSGSVFDFSGSTNRIEMMDGLLTAGVYQFVIMTTSFSPAQRGIGDTRSAFQFNLEFADPAVNPTPEPASLLLLGTGIAGIVARRRMTRR